MFDCRYDPFSEVHRARCRDRFLWLQSLPVIKFASFRQGILRVCNPELNPGNLSIP